MCHPSSITLRTPSSYDDRPYYQVECGDTHVGVVDRPRNFQKRLEKAAAKAIRLHDRGTQRQRESVKAVADVTASMNKAVQKVQDKFRITA